MQKAFQQHLGDTTNHILYHLGKIQARTGGQIMYKRFGFKRSRKTVELSNEQSQMVGIGKPQLVKFDMENRHFIIRNLNTPFAKEYLRLYGKQEHAVDHFIRGVMAGAYESHTDSKGLVAIETQCMAMGKSHCLFEIRPEERWDKSDPMVKRQMPEEVLDDSFLEGLKAHLTSRR